MGSASFWSSALLFLAGAAGGGAAFAPGAEAAEDVVGAAVFVVLCALAKTTPAIVTSAKRHSVLKSVGVAVCRDMSRTLAKRSRVAARFFRGLLFSGHERFPDPK